MSKDVDVSKSALTNAFSFKQNFQSIFQRRASNYAAIDGLRAVSILLVLVYHTLIVYDRSNPQQDLASIFEYIGIGWAWAWNGDKGVDVFFVMSGFLITGILLKQHAKTGHLNLKNFYLRRYLRLTPAYYLMLIIYWLLAGPNSEWIWANFLYINNFIDYGHQAASWTWSLAVEEQFYFIYPLILIAILKYSKSPGYLLLWLFLFSFVVRAGIVLTDGTLRTSPFSRVYTDHEYLNHYFTVIYDDLHTRFGGLLVGCMAAYNLHFHKEKLTKIANSKTGVALTVLGLLLIIFFIGFPAFSPEYDSYQTFHMFYYMTNRNFFAMGIGIIILAMLLQQHIIARVLNTFFSFSFWYPIASLSYSLYLIHLVVMIIVIPAINKLTITMPEQYDWSMGQVLIISFVISSSISFVIAVFMYLFVEKPIMNLRR